MNKYEEILRIFVNKNTTSNVWQQSPFTIHDKTFATDGVSMVYFNKELCQEQNYLEPDINEKVLKHIKPFNKSKFIPISKISETIEKHRTIDGYDLVGEDIDCPACDGDGKVVWEFDWKSRTHTHEDECPICHGDGLESEAKKVPNGKKEIDDNHNLCIEIGDSTFSLINLHNMVRVCEILNLEQVELVYQDKNNLASFFKCNDVFILLMPLLRDTSSEIIALSICA